MMIKMVSSKSVEKPPALELNTERLRVAEAHEQTKPWYRWVPYLSERQWGTVREDYSPSGNAWDFFPHDHAPSRTYRWGEDGLLGICDEQGLLCFALGLWNEADPILKERLFGLTGSEGNHGEDVKEYYYFLDSTPTHSYMKALYKYPQRAFPYADLAVENRRRGRGEPEYELIDTGVFAQDRYFDVTIEYAKVEPEDILVRITAANRGPEAAPLHVLPTLWFRNTWAWGYDHDEENCRPELRAVESLSTPTGAVGEHVVRATHATLGEYWLACQRSENEPQLLFTENESNAQGLWGVPNRTPFVKDGIHDAVVNGAQDSVNPEGFGTKVPRTTPSSSPLVRLRRSYCACPPCSRMTPSQMPKQSSRHGKRKPIAFI
jgi:hypothetical protein